MDLAVKKHSIQYAGIFLVSLFSGYLVSMYSFSVLALLGLILFTIISFKYFDKVLLLAILYIPFQVALNISPGIDLASGRVLILYLFVVWIIKSLAEKKFTVRFNLQTLLFLLFLFIAGFSALGAWDIERAIRKILVFLSVFPLYFIITSISGKGEQTFVRLRGSIIENRNNYIYKILGALFISGFILSLIGIVQFTLQFFIGIDPIMKFWSEYVSPIFYGETFGAQVVANPSWLVNISGLTVLRAFSLFPDPHMFSFYLGLLIPIALAIVLCTTNSPPDKGGWGVKGIVQNNKIFTLITMLIAEILTFSRGGYLGMISGIGAVIILGWRYISFYKRIALGLTAALAIVFLLTANQSVANRFFSSFDSNEGSNTERMENWSQGWEIFNDNILTGVGIGNYSLAVDPIADYRTPIYAHNLYLDIGAEMGVFALIVWIMLIGVTIYQLFKLSRSANDNFTRSVSLGLIGSFVWFSAHSFFDTPIYSPTILAAFMIIVSISVVAMKLNRKL